MRQGVPALSYGTRCTVFAAWIFVKAGPGPPVGCLPGSRIDCDTVRQTGLIILAGRGEPMLKRRLTGVDVVGCCGVLCTTTCNGC